MNRIFFTGLLLMSALFGQTQPSLFQSSNYKYTINIPVGFKEKPAQGPHIDFKVADQVGSSVTVNVSSRLAEEKGIDAHDYSRDYFQTMFNQSSIKYVISQTQKILIDNTKAFLINYSYPTNRGIILKTIQAYLFVGDNAYVITATTDENHYNNYKNVFLQTIKSLKFQNK